MAIAAIDLVSRYRALRDKVKEIKERHAAELAPYTAGMDALEVEGLRLMHETGADSIKTGEGTMYQSVRSSYTVTDAGIFRGFIEAHNRPDMLEMRVAKSVVEAYVSETNSLPPGLATKVDIVVNFRK